MFAAGLASIVLCWAGKDAQKSVASGSVRSGTRPIVHVLPFMTMGSDNTSDALTKMSERMEKKGGKIVGSFAFSSRNVTNEELAARTREMARFR